MTHTIVACQFGNSGCWEGHYIFGDGRMFLVLMARASGREVQGRVGASGQRWGSEFQWGKSIVIVSLHSSRPILHDDLVWC